MKKWIVLVFALMAASAFAQGRLGVKGGLNFTNVLPLSETLGSVNGQMGLYAG
jgi:hypothetical protein